MPTKSEPRDLTSGQVIYNLPENIATAVTIIRSAAAEALECYRWATNNRPHLVHLALHAKRRRNRKKNLHRIVREFLEDKYGKK